MLMAVPRMPVSGKAKTMGVAPVRPGGMVARGWRVLREHGPATLGLRILYAMRLYRCCLVTSSHIDQRTVAMERASQSRLEVECAQLGPADLDDYMAFRPDQSRAAIQARFDAGHVCFVARRGGRIIGASWVCVGRAWIDELGCAVVLADDAYYVYDHYVSPEFRGRQVMGPIGTLRRAYIREVGCAWSIGVIWRENYAAFGRHRKRGGAVIGTIGSYGIGPWQRHFLRLDAETDDPTPPLVTLGRSR